MPDKDQKHGDAPPSRDRFALTVVVSLLVHALVALAWGAWPTGGADDGRRLQAAFDEEQAPESDEVKLGIERSSAVTVSWLGFEEPRPQEARQAPVEQSALSLAMAGGGSGTPSESARNSLIQGGAEPSSENESEADPDTTETSESASSEWLDPAQLAEWVAPSVERAGRGFAAVREALEAAAARSRALAEEQAAQQSQPAVASTAEPSPGPPGPGQAPEAENEDVDPEQGIPSDRQSPATSIEAPVDVHIGQVAATEGLEIKTRRPRWTTRTRVIARPRNPVVQISFDAKGRVRKADFVTIKGQRLDTGYESVDEPLLSAIYLWTASGARIDELPKDDPDARLDLTMRIFLR